ncbi:MAG: tail fiber protein, partial [Sphingomonadales bacterium]
MRGRVPIGNGFAGDAPAGTLALSWLIAAKFAPEWGYGPGLLTLFAGRNAPDGWIVADGRLIKIAAEPALFAAIGSRFGGDGLGNFALPDLRGRTVIGAGERPGEDPLMPGQVVNAAGPGGIPALALHYLICVQGMFANFERFSGFGTRLPFVGQIMASASEEVSDDWIRAERHVDQATLLRLHLT